MKNYLLICCLMLISVTIFAQGNIVEIDGIQYYVDYDKATAALTDLTANFNSTSLTIPEKITVGGKQIAVTSISANGLPNKGLTELTVPSTVTFVFNTAFANNTEISVLHWNARKLESWSGQPLGAVADNLHDVYFGSEVEEIHDEMFLTNQQIEHIYFADDQPLQLQRIGKNAFVNNTKLQELDLSKGSNIEVAQSAFENCSALTILKLDNVATVGNAAFRNCKNLQTVSMPNTLAGTTTSTIGASAFYGCEKLNELIFRNFIESVGAQAFAQIAVGASVVIEWQGESYVTLSANNVFVGVEISSVTIPCKYLDYYDSLWQLLYEQPNTIIPYFQALSLPTSLQGGTIEVLQEPDCKQQSWTLEALAENDNYQFDHWDNNSTEPIRQLSVEDYYNDYYLNNLQPTAFFSIKQASDIENTTASSAPKMVVEDGQLLILVGSSKYNLLGAQIR